MQVTGMKAGVLGTKYNGAIDALRSIVRTEGFQGLYRGLWPNLRMSFICFHLADLQPDV
jgi:solute carrier family 25 (mitochondrial phosphate transporter), member 23/24/25/41